MLVSCICYKNYFYYLVYWIIELLVSIFKNFIYKANVLQIGIKNDLMDEYTNLVNLNIADLLAGFLVLYTICSLPTKVQTKKKLLKEDIEIVNKEKNPYNKNQKICLLIVVSFLDFISRSGYFWFFIIFNKGRLLNRYYLDILIAIDIFMRYFFSRIILKTKLYKHHFWAIIITIIGFASMTALDIISIIKDNKDVSDKFLFLLFIFPKSICYPLEDVINKKLLSDDFLLPHTLMFERGLIELIILLIISLILFLTGKLTFTFNYDENFIKIFLFKIVKIFISFTKSFCLMKIIYIFTSQCVSFLIVSESLAGTLNFLININITEENIPFNKEMFLTIELLSLLFVIFGTLMYNEMIIINKCGLQENTKNGLLIKERKESQSTIKIDKDNDEIDEEDNNNVNIINDIDIDDNSEDDEIIGMELNTH